MKKYSNSLVGSSMPKIRVAQGGIDSEPSYMDLFRYKVKLFTEDHPHLYMLTGGLVLVFLAIIIYRSGLGYTEKAASKAVEEFCARVGQAIKHVPHDMIFKVLDSFLDEAKRTFSSSDFGHYKFCDQGIRLSYTDSSLFPNITK